MKIDDLLKGLKGPTAEERICKYIEQHADEVYEYSDETLAKVFPEYKENTRDWILWNLSSRKRIEKITIGRRVYFGSSEAIEDLRKRLKKVE